MSQYFAAIFFLNLALKLFVTFLNAVKFCDVIVRKLIVVIFD